MRPRGGRGDHARDTCGRPWTLTDTRQDGESGRRRLPHLRQPGCLAWRNAVHCPLLALMSQGTTSKEKCRMTAPPTWPTGKNKVAAGNDDDDETQFLPDRAPAHMVISDMADLLRDTRASMMKDGCLLGAITIGFALEAGLSARQLHFSLAGVINLGLLAGIVVCWLAAVFLLARAGRPVLSTLSELRWVTGAPLDPRPGWVTLPPGGGRSGGMDMEARVPAARGGAPGPVPHAVRGHVDLLHRRLLPGLDHGRHARPVTAGRRGPGLSPGICQQPLDGSSLEPGRQ